jgi:hypothetical protein
LYDSVAGATQTLDVDNIRGAGGAGIGIPIDIYSFQLQTIGANGMVSAGSEIIHYNKTT